MKTKIENHDILVVGKKDGWYVLIDTESLKVVGVGCYLVHSHIIQAVITDGVRTTCYWGDGSTQEQALKDIHVASNSKYLLADTPDRIRVALERLSEEGVLIK